MVSAVAHYPLFRAVRGLNEYYPPLNSPSSSFKPRLPAVARLNARGPQGRLLLQGHTLDGSGAFRSVPPPPCTVWPRTVMRGKSRKVNSGHNSVPKANRRTEPSPRNPRFAAHLRCVSAKEGKGSQEGTGNHTWCPVPFCLRRQTAAIPPPPGGGNFPPPWVRRLCRETPAIPPPWVRRFLRRQTAALPAAEGGNSSPVNTGNPPAAEGGNHSLHLLGNPL